MSADTPDTRTPSAERCGHGGEYQDGRHMDCMGWVPCNRPLEPAPLGDATTGAEPTEEARCGLPMYPYGIECGRPAGHDGGHVGPFAIEPGQGSNAPSAPNRAADGGPVCCTDDCCGPGSYCCARANPHTHDEGGE